MKSSLCFLFFLAPFVGAVALGASPPIDGPPYRNIETRTEDDAGKNSVGWGSCAVCTGGQNEEGAALWSVPDQITPSNDGTHRAFFLSGGPYANGLWWYKIGANNKVRNFTFDFRFQVDGSDTNAQAYEFDVFQYVVDPKTGEARRFMFGTQCDYAKGAWEVWDELHGKWLASRIKCQHFEPHVWYHIVEKFHRNNVDMHEYYDTLIIKQEAPKTPPDISDTPQAFKMVTSSGPLPKGWGENLGVQFQMDIGPRKATLAEWLDQVTLDAK